jgi:hypothetical protein
MARMNWENSFEIMLLFVKNLGIGKSENQEFRIEQDRNTWIFTALQPA